MIAASKLFVPPLRETHVPRPTVMRRFATERRLAAVVAPAGYGKTTALAELLRSTDEPNVLLSLDRRDGDPVRFWSHVGEALSRMFDGLGKKATVSLRGQPPAPVDRVIDAWSDELHAGDVSGVLALDDYHLIDDPAIHEALGLFIDRAPPGLRIVVATRVPPPLPLARWRAAGELIEVTDSALRFSRDEAGRFLRQTMGREIERVHLDALLDRTEGWAAALQLAALSLAAPLSDGGDGDIAALVRTFRGDQKHMAAYLAEQMLDRQTAEARDFLLRISVLDGFCAPLCQAVTGIGVSECQARLESLERDNLPIVALDGDGRWFRYHHLFAEFSRARLARERPGEKARAHLAAARWYRDEGNLEDAFGHALAAGDRDLAEAILTEVAPAMNSRSEPLAVLRSVRALARPLGALNTPLVVTMGWACFLTGHLAELEQVFAEVEKRRKSGGVPDPEWAQICNMRAGLARQRGDVARSLELCHEALSCTPADYTELRAGHFALSRGG